MKFFQYCAINSEKGSEMIKFMCNSVYILNVVIGGFEKF